MDQRVDGLREAEVPPLAEVVVEPGEVGGLSAEVKLVSQGGAKLPDGLVQPEVAERWDVSGEAGHYLHDPEVHLHGAIHAGMADLYGHHCAWLEVSLCGTGC
eukprot:scaffold562480_cov23-Prasinocladus_malaysianus.AAC.1